MRVLTISADMDKESKRTWEHNRMYRLLVVFCLFAAVPSLVHSEDTTRQHMVYADQTYALYPTLLNEKPNIPSPLTAGDGTEYLVCITWDNKYAIISVTVENGEPLNYREDLWYGKGRQLDVDSLDFPTLAASGLHSNAELDRTKTITGRPVDQITSIARPEEYSTIGFIAHDEDIVSVLKGDNELVHEMGLTHPELAKPLFHIFNVVLTVSKDSNRGDMRGILYNSREIDFKFWGAKGWQESIFDDEILGYWEIDIWTDLNHDELGFLSRQYSNLPDENRAELIRRLSFIHTGEMVPYYIMRYGFYEGHTGYRADPITVASIFGLRTMKELTSAFEGDLNTALSMHHVSDDSHRSSPEEK